MKKQHYRLNNIRYSTTNSFYPCFKAVCGQGCYVNSCGIPAGRYGEYTGRYGEYTAVNCNNCKRTHAYIKDNMAYSLIHEEDVTSWLKFWRDRIETGEDK